MGRRLVDCTDMYWAADRIGGPVGKTKCTETEAFSGKCRADARARRGYCPQASLASAKVAREGTRAPGRSLEFRGHCGTFLLKEAAS